MIRVTLELLPSFSHLYDCRSAIAMTHGEQRANEWFGTTFKDDTRLFVRCVETPTKPTLTLIDGGAQ